MRKIIIGINYPIFFLKKLQLLFIIICLSGLFSYKISAQGNTCATATPLTINGTCGSGTINGTTEFPPTCSGWLRAEYYSFTVSSGPQTITITAQTSARNLALGLFSGTCGSLTNIACQDADNTNGAQTETITATNLANGTYYIAVGNTRNSDIALTSICVTAAPPPTTNFTCATATTLACGTTALAGTTVGSPGTPAHGTTCSMSNYGAWYTFVGDGQLTTISSTAGAGFDHEMSISSGSCGSFTNIACRDSGLSGGTESHTFSTTVGVIYNIYIAHYLSGSTTTGTFTISRTCSAPIANDNCSGAINVTVNPTRTCTATTPGTLFGATDSGVTGSTCGGTDDDDVWFSFTATATTHYIELLNVAGSTTDLYHAVYSGTCGTLGAALLCSDPNTSVISGLTIGNTYYLQVYSWTSTTGQNSTFDVCISTNPPCTTPGAQANSFTPGTITSTAFPATFSGTADSYLVIRSTSATPPSQPVNGVVYNAGNIGTLGTGLTFVQSGTSTTITGTGLTGNTHYYYYIYAYNNTNCSGGPLYNTSGPLTGNAITCPSSPSPVSTGSTLTSINFSWPSSIGGGANAVSYQLQVTSDAGYTINVPGSPFTINDPTTTHNVTGLAANTTYYYRIRANNGCWSNYTTGSAITGYCAYTTSSSSYWISNFNTTGGVANINRNSTYTAGGYANYSATDIVSQNEGVSFNFSVTMSSGTHGVNIYVDWNNDLDFNDAGELVYASGGYVSNATGSITIPVGTSTGNHRMRVVSNYLSTSPSACGSNTYTEAEDYTINCLGPLPCSGNPSNIAVNVLTTSTADVTWTAATPAPANGYQYYLSTSNTNPTMGTTPTGSVGAGVTTINLTGLTSSTTYYIWIRSNCGGGLGQGAWVGPVSFYIPNCSFGNSLGTTSLGCPSVISGGLGLNGADPAAINCSSVSNCVDLEATYLQLGDTSNYTVESIPYAPPYQFNCLKNPVSVNIDDTWSGPISLPFDFCFYGNSYNQCTIGSNGILSFDMTNAGNGSGYSFSNNLPSTVGALFENSIYGVYHDIDPSVSGEVGWELITLNTGCRALVAAWHDVPMFSNNSILYTGMMVLYENTNVIEVYIENKEVDGTWNGGNAIVGLQNANGTAAVVAPGRNGLDADWTVTNEAWRFVPAGPSITSIAWHEGSGVSGPIVGTTDVINVCPGTTTTYTAEITYSLCDGSTLKETEETTVTVTGNKVWNGSVSTDWNIANNWTPSGVPTALDCVVIAPTVNDPIISGAGYNGLGLNLTVQNGATITVNTNSNLTITDWININPTGDLVLQNSASLVQVNNVANTGNMNMNRTANIRIQDYVYWSSPVSSFNSNLISTGTPTGYIYKWEPTIPSNTNGFGNWLSGNETMAIGKGYIVRGPSSYTNTLQNYTALFTGTPNNGNISTPIFRGTYNGADYTGPTSTLVTRDDDNWNLLGNPYPSALNAIDFLTLNSNIDGFIKIWTHGTLPVSSVDPFYQDFEYNYTPSDYITYNITGTSSGPGVFNGFIGAAQGFFVSMLHTTASSSETVQFNNSMRNYLYDNSQFYRSSQNNALEKNRIWLDLIGPDNSNVRTLIGYIDTATNNRDRLFDAITDEKLDLNLYSQIGNESFSIQGRANPFNDDDIVSLGLEVPNTGLYSISIASIDGLFETTNQDIFLEDLENNIVHDLRSNPYIFNISEGTNNNRFILKFKDNRLSNEDIEELENNIWVISNDILTVRSTKYSIKSITIHDVIGRLIEQKKNINSNEILFNSIHKNKSTLLLKIELENGTIINKKIIF